jgi:hypothetical protein
MLELALGAPPAKCFLRLELASRSGGQDVAAKTRKRPDNMIARGEATCRQSICRSPALTSLRFLAARGHQSKEFHFNKELRRRNVSDFLGLGLVRLFQCLIAIAIR